MSNLNENFICILKKLLSSQTAFNQIHYKKTANIVGIFATSRLVMHFSCGHNLRRFARGDCILL